MSVHITSYLMVCASVPKSLWDGDNFYDKYEDQMLNSDLSASDIGILYDSMSGSYCYYGVVLAVSSLGDDWDHKVCITSERLAELESDTRQEFRDMFDVLPEDLGLRVVDGYS